MEERRVGKRCPFCGKPFKKDEQNEDIISWCRICDRSGCEWCMPFSSIICPECEILLRFGEEVEEDDTSTNIP